MVFIDFNYIHDHASSTKMGEYLTEEESNLILNCIKDKNNLLILDIGGGSGRFSITLKKMQNYPIVLEVDKIPLEILTKKTKNIPSVLADGQYLPFKTNTFDAILAIEVIEYPQDKDIFLRESYRVLKNNGFLIISILNKFSYKILHPNRIKRPTFYFNTYWQFKKRLENTGFKVKKSYGYSWIPFGRFSNSNLIPIFQKIENFLKLHRFAFISPSVVFKAGKKSE